MQVFTLTFNLEIPTLLSFQVLWYQHSKKTYIYTYLSFHFVHSDEYTYVPMVVEAILSMPEGTHIAVRKTCILLLGELCEWIERHGECLEPCLQFLIRALQDKQLAYAAATALQVSIGILILLVDYIYYNRILGKNQVGSIKQVSGEFEVGPRMLPCGKPQDVP